MVGGKNPIVPGEKPAPEGAKVEIPQLKLSDCVPNFN
jgi:hypothetical protein